MKLWKRNAVVARVSTTWVLPAPSTWDRVLASFSSRLSRSYAYCCRCSVAAGVLLSPVPPAGQSRSASPTSRSSAVQRFFWKNWSTALLFHVNPFILFLSSGM